MKWQNFKKIIDCLKRITPNINSERFIQPGAIYRLPPMDKTKLNPFTSDFIENNNLTKIYQGMSPILSKEILFRHDNGISFKNIMTEIKESSTLYLCKTENKEYFHLMELHLECPEKKSEVYWEQQQNSINVKMISIRQMILKFATYFMMKTINVKQLKFFMKAKYM